MRWVLLGFLTLLAALAALATADRTRPGGRAELALTTCILWNALIACPIYALGFTDHLRATPLAWLSGILFAAVLGATAWRGSLLRSVREFGSTLVEFLTLPFAGIAAATRARSLVALAVTAVGVLIFYTAIVSYFSPSWRGWDSLWYHETIVGLTMQNHGFALPDLPGDLQKANGYPKLCEMTQLWFVIFTDRRLIELPNSLLAPGFMLATYVIARRYTRDVVSCMGWAAVVMLMPASANQLQSTYIDVHVGLLVLAAVHYATRPVYRIVDAWLAALCITMAIGSKYLVLPPIGIVTIIAFVRLIRHHGFRLRSLATMLGGIVLIGGMSASIFLRNWLYFRNPLWPDLTYDNPKYGIHLPSVYYAPNALDMNMPFKELLSDLISIPYSVSGLGSKGLLYEYGFGVSMIIFPLSALALVGILWLCGRDIVARILRVRSWRSPDAYNPLIVALPVAAQLLMSPALWASRYQLASVGAMACLVAYWGGRRRWSAFGEGAAAAAVVASLVATLWSRPRWLWFPSELVKLAAVPYPEREVTPAPSISADVDRHSGSSITKEVGIEREKLKPGEIVAYNDSVQFPALLWNNTFSNRVVFLEGAPPAVFLQEVNAVHARWVYCRNGPPDCALIVAQSTGAQPAWRDVGVYNTENWGHIYARVGP
jgi:hypothetical protein